VSTILASCPGECQRCCMFSKASRRAKRVMYEQAGGEICRPVAFLTVVSSTARDAGRPFQRLDVFTAST
jgi:hypothetical protein